SSVNAWSLAAYWQPEESGWIPSISAGWGLNAYNYAHQSKVVDGTVTTSQSWMVGLEWSDLFVEGNSGGMAFGEPTFATDIKGSDTPHDGNYVWEWWYKFQVTDNIVVTPAIYYLSRPLGELTSHGANNNKTFSQLGGVLRTTFMF
ncbi:MAG: porin, partial [bacterium]|nr:porin [bacterium]